MEFIQSRSDIYGWDGVQETILTTLRFSRFIRTFPQVCTLKQNLIIQGPRPFSHEDIWLEGQWASTNQVHWGEHIVLIQLKKGNSNFQAVKEVWMFFVKIVYISEWRPRVPKHIDREVCKILLLFWCRHCWIGHY